MKKNGFVALISVIIVSAIVLSISIFVVLSNLNVSLSAFLVSQSEQARNLAKTCSEKAIFEILENSNYNGVNSYNFSQGSCDYEVINLTFNRKQINSTGQFRSIFRKDIVVIEVIDNNLNIISWQDNIDF